MYSGSFSCPALASVDGVFYVSNLPVVRTLHFASMQNVTGQMTFDRMPLLGNLCGLRMEASGYTTNLPVCVVLSFIAGVD